ncbi:MAG: hypothetical protein OEL82_10090 [Nitrosopumilus sp.]|nr:hypothetical protein [Nitrosopumilus sp.]
MNKTTMAFTVLALAAVFALVTPMDVAVAQTSNAVPDGDGEYKDGEHEGKSCPSKEGKMQKSTHLT